MAGAEEWSRGFGLGLGLVLGLRLGLGVGWDGDWDKGWVRAGGSARLGPWDWIRSSRTMKEMG